MLNPGEDFKLYDWEIRSSGKLQDTLELVQKHPDFEMVIVDEAHNFRNQDTEDNELLSLICKNRIVILITATPFNNSPADIFSLLKLFVVPGKSKITLSDNLDDRFRDYERTFKKLSFISRYHNSPDAKKRTRALAYNEQLFETDEIDLDKLKRRTRYLSDRIRAVIEPVVIRRNRIDLQKDPEYSKEVQNLTEVKDPCELFFALTKEQSEFYDKVINNYFSENGRFTGAIYRPFEYEIGFDEEVDETEPDEGNAQDRSEMEKNRERLIQKNLYDFMRRLVVKRFESSFGAFQQSITNFLNITTKVQTFINRTDKYILDRKLLGKIYGYDLEDIEKELVKFAERIEKITKPNPKTDKVYEVNKFKDKERFRNNIENDRQLFNQILAELQGLKLVDNDPKSDSLITELKNIIYTKSRTKEPNRKVVIFSEYIDTVKHLEPKIAAHFKDKFITVAGDLPAVKADEILENFDASYDEPKNKYDILIASDRISEGVNLNRAGAVINYDIPWNPTRVIQRVGRLNRISKKVFEEIYLYNFFPTVQGADIVKSREIASNKMFLIHNTLGEDVKIFAPDETPSASKLYTKIMQNPEKAEEESFQTKIRQKYHNIKKAYPEIIKRIEQLPPRIKTAKNHAQNNLLVFIKKGLGFFVRGIMNDNQEVENLIFEEIYNHIECARDEKRIPFSHTFWERYEAVKEFKESIYSPSGPQSIEEKARFNLNTMRQSPVLEEFFPFIRILLEDILEYKTLPIYTLRRISVLKIHNAKDSDLAKAKEELTLIKKGLGEDYLDKIKERSQGLSKNIIIAVENITL